MLRYGNLLKVVLREGRSPVAREHPRATVTMARMDHKGRGTLALESGYQGLDRQRRATLGPIIHKHVRTLSLSHDLLNQRRGVLSHARLCGDDPAVGCVSFDGFLIGKSERREEPDNDMGGR